MTIAPIRTAQSSDELEPDIIEPRSPRVLARITEEDGEHYGWRCETCGPCTDPASLLHLAAKYAHEHAVKSGHAVLVEAL